MTRKHFKLIAKVVSEVKSKKVKREIAVAFANELWAFNPKFNRMRFISACLD